MNFLPQNYLIGLAIAAVLGAVATPLVVYLRQILKRLDKADEQWEELKALVVASLEEAIAASEGGKPISKEAVLARLAQLKTEAGDVIEALKTPVQ